MFAHTQKGSHTGLWNRYDAAGRERSQYHEVCWGRIAAGSHVRPGVKLRVAAYDRQRLRHEIALTSGLCTVDPDIYRAVAFSTHSILSAEILHRARLDLSLHLRSQTCQQDKPPEHYLAVRVMVRSPSTLVSSLGPARPRPQMCWPLPTDPARDHVRSSVRPCLPLPSR